MGVLNLGFYLFQVADGAGSEQEERIEQLLKEKREHEEALKDLEERISDAEGKFQIFILKILVNMSNIYVLYFIIWIIPINYNTFSLLDTSFVKYSVAVILHSYVKPDLPSSIRF